MLPRIATLALFIVALSGGITLAQTPNGPGGDVFNSTTPGSRSTQKTTDCRATRDAEQLAAQQQYRAKWQACNSDVGCETRAYREWNEKAYAIDQQQARCLIAQQPQQQQPLSGRVQQDESRPTPSTPQYPTYPSYPSPPPRQVPTAPRPTQPQKPSVAATNTKPLRGSIKISANLNGFLNGTTEETRLGPDYMVLRGNVVRKTTNQVVHGVHPQPIWVQIENRHDNNELVGPIKMKGVAPDFYQAFKGRVTRKVPGYVTPGQDVFHVTTLYDAKGHEYPVDMHATLQ